MGLSKKIIKCTIAFVNNPDFTCDLWLWQDIPNELGIYAGYFKRIINNKRLQIEANEGSWEFGYNPKLDSWVDAIFFYKTLKPPKKGPHFFNLQEVPFNFLDLVIAGLTLSGKDRGVIYKPPNFLNWRMWV